MLGSYWRFIDAAALQPGTELATSYDPALVAFSVLAAIVAGYTALKVVERMATARGRARVGWLVTGALAMGAGIWSMHFLGMLALRLPVAVGYSGGMTVLAFLPAFGAAGVAIHLVDRGRVSASLVAVGGLVLAAGIGTMHFLGMEALRVDAVMAYRPASFFLSILVAWALASGALTVQFLLPRRLGRLGTPVAAVLMGAAVAGMHYTAMGAAVFLPVEEGLAGVIQAPGWLGGLVVGATVLVLGLAIGSTVMDYHLAVAADSLSQAQLRAARILDVSPEAVVTMDEEGRIVDWNQHAEELFGWAASEVVGERVIDLMVPKRHQDDFERGVAYALARSGEPLKYRQEIEALHRNRWEVPVEVSVTTVDLDGRTLFLAFLHDIATRLAARRGLEEAIRVAEAATRAKGDFLANMSHEIRTPMNGVIGMSQLLLETELSKEQFDYADTIRRSAESLLTIINDILDFSKVEAGKIDLETVDFGVRTTVEDVVELLAPKAEQHGIEIMCQIRAGVPQVVGGDPGRLRQVLVNLVSNAVKFTHEGEVVVSVDVEGEDEDGILLRFDVRDTGIGIEPSRLAAVFDSFTQADTSTTRRYGGTGLGLAIARRLVELMGGGIDASSEVGKGSVFTFTSRFEKRSAPARPRRSWNAGARVLVVDDNATNRRILCDQLTLWGLKHAEAESGDEALVSMLRAAEEGVPFDVALLDFQMPEMDGMILGRIIKADPALRETELVMLTSVGRRGETARYTELGFAAYLVKPIKQSYLYDCLVAVLSGDKAPGESRPLITKHLLENTRRREDLNILLVEDNKVNQFVAQAILKKLGYRCDVAENGKEAVAAVEGGDYDLVLMDCQLPIMDGYEATETIRRMEEGTGVRVPIVAMTANAMAGDREKCIAAGMDDYVTKPIDGEELKATLRRMLVGRTVDQAEERRGAQGAAATVGAEESESGPSVAAAKVSA